jgi:hypothetical protein
VYPVKAIQATAEVSMKATNLRKMVQPELDFEKAEKPLYRVQEYIVALTESAALLHNLLVQVKELVLLVGLISFSALGIVYILLHLH